MTAISRALLLALALAIAAWGQTFTQCDINKDNALTIVDVQDEINEAMGTAAGLNDLNGDNVVNVVDVQIVINGVLGLDCFRDLTMPTFALTTVTLLNQAFIPADIPSPGNITITSTVAGSASVLNQAWIPADIPSPGNVTITGAFASPASVLNQAWIPADIPSPGNVTVTGALARPVSVLNQAWISADIPSPGDVRFVAGLLVSVNNTGTPGLSMHSNLGVKAIGAGSSTAPVDLSSVHDGDALIAGQTVRFRLYPPEGAIPGSDFLVNGAPLRIHAPFEVLLTAPANASGFDLQAVMYAIDGRVWRMPAKHLQVLADPGVNVSGYALRADGSPAVSAPMGVRTNGLTAAYFREDKGLASWSELSRDPDKLGIVTAINQPNPAAVFGPDPFGTGFSGPFAARFRGDILVSMAGLHRFFLDGSLGARLSIDGSFLIDAPAGRFSPELEGGVTLKAGWHTIEIDSYQTSFHSGLQFSWEQPNSGRETVRPEALATELGPLAVTDANGAFSLGSFPSILNPLEWHSIPADEQIRVVLDQPTSQQRPIPQ